MPTAQSKSTSPKKPSVKKESSRTYFYAVGKRKTSIAKVKLYPKGSGSVLINEKKAEEYFSGTSLEKILLPFSILGDKKGYDVEASVLGGGKMGQSDAVCHGISRALTICDDGLRIVLKRAGLLTRDSRTKERKKYGLKKARRSPQWSKR